MSWENIPGWFSWPSLYNEMVETAPRGGTIVEVGCAFGRSLAYLARRAIDSGKDLKIYGVDTFDTEISHWEEDRVKRLMYGIKSSHFSAFLNCMISYAPEELGYIRLIRASSEKASRLFLYAQECHAVFIDANHSYQSVKADIEAWGVKAKMLAGHDLDLGDVKRACDEMLNYRGVAAEPTKGDLLKPGMGHCWVRV